MDLDQIHLNNQLCNYLRKKVGKTKSVLEYHKSASAGRATNSQEKAFREVELVVKRAEDLLLKCMCTQSSWLDATITLADIKEEVLDIVLDLSFWKRMLKIATVHSDKGRLASLQYVAKALKKDEDLHEKLLKAGSSLQEAADADMSHLLTKLLEVKEKHASGGGGSSASEHEREYVLSIYLLASLKEDDRIATEVESQLKEMKWGESLGSGASGQVNEVEWLQQQCAVKLVQHTDPKEATFPRGCNHPHIVRFFWFWQEEKMSYIIMERMHEDLSKHIKRLVGRTGGRPFQLHVAIDIMLQVAKAMYYLHNKKLKKIVHSDLKTSNILVQPLADSSEGYVHVKLADFGMSKPSSSLTFKRATSVYAAPEVFNLESKHGNNRSKNLLPKIDVWSFAMVCSEILTGTMPFDGEPEVNILYSIIEENNEFRPHLPSDCPEDLRFCITRCWECDPQKRPEFGEVCKMLKLAKAQSLGIIDCELLSTINHPMPKNPTSRLVTSEPQAASAGDSSVNMTGGLQENLKLEQLLSVATAISCLNPGSSSGSEVVDPVFVEKLDHEKPSGFRLSRYSGVRFRPDLSKWVAEIKIPSQSKPFDEKIWLGTYISEVGAALAADAARKVLKCSKKRPNFSCDRLDAFTEVLPPHLSLNDPGMLKSVSEFVKGKARQYASEVLSALQQLPISIVANQGIGAHTPVTQKNKQPDFGDESSSKTAPPISRVRKCSDELELGHLRMSVTEDRKIPNTCGQLFKRQKVTATTENTKVANKLSTCQILHQEPQRNVILVAGRQDAGGDSVEFVFQMAENMARVVGVGFNWSKVVINRQYDVSIRHVGESAWSDLWNEVRTEATPHNDSNSFSLMNIEFLTMPTEQVDPLYNLTAQESSKRFGVGLEGSGVGVHVYAHDNNIQSGEDFPLIFSLLEHMGFKRENAKDLGKQHSGTSSSKATSSGNNTETSTKEEKCLPQQNQGPTKKNHGDNEDEESRHPPEDSGLQQHSQSPIDPKDTSLIVIVFAESGGTFHRGSTNDIEYPRDSIKLAAMAPQLEFKFEKLANYRKITTTTTTLCHLGGGEPKYPELDCGYYQNNITISFKCEKKDAARLSSSGVTAIVSTKQTTVKTFTDSSSLARQTGGQIGGQVQIPVVGIGFQAQGNMNVTSTIGGGSSLAESEEISNTQFAGFDVNPAYLEGSQVYNFLYCTDVLRLIGNNPAKFISAGICRTLSPTIVGEWDALDMDDACLYNFKTERDLMSIGDLMQSFASWKVPYMRQRYQVPFYINHAMTHIGGYGTTVIIRGPGEQRLEKVLTKYPEIA